MKAKILSALLVLAFFSVSFAQSAGDLIITEIMQNPSDVNDSAGEWFEIYNTTDADIALDGMVISDDGSNSFTVGSDVIISAKSFFVFGCNDDQSTNGGVAVDYDYSYSSFYLGNSDDEVILTTSGGVEIDRVEYDGGPNFPDPNGASMVFIGSETDDNNDYSFWSTSTERTNYISDGSDLGSPGVQGLSDLPVELTSFTADCIGETNYIELKWCTATEKNNYGFDIQRSYDGSSFEDAGSVRGAGESSSPIEYSFIDTISAGFDSVFYRLKQVDNGGAYEYSKVITVAISESKITDVDDEVVNCEFTLAQNYPNPFNPSTTIRFTIPESASGSASTKLYVFNTLGERVAVLVDQNMSAGEHEVQFNAGNLASGIYFYRLQYGNLVQTKKLILMK